MGQHTLLLKAWPTSKVFFHSPIGLTDRGLDDLSPEQQYEQVMYDVYVDRSAGSLFGG